MTAKEQVLSLMPTAKSERQVTNGGETYWLIRERGKNMYYAEGETEAKAWKNARIRLMEDFNREMVG